jgi:hypothetical protein
MGSDVVPDEVQAHTSPYLSVPFLQALQTLTTGLCAGSEGGWIDLDSATVIGSALDCCTEQLMKLHAAHNAQ